MECKECGTSVANQVHENYICFDCYCLLSLADHEAEVQKKTSEEEEQGIPFVFGEPTPSHPGVIAIIVGHSTVGAIDGLFHLQ